MTQKSSDLPGMEGPGVAQPRIASIDDAIIEYVGHRDRRCAITPEEVKTKSRLSDLMHAAETDGKLTRDPKGVLRYRHDSMIVELRPGKETLKVVNDDQGGGDEGNDAGGDE